MFQLSLTLYPNHMLVLQQFVPQPQSAIYGIVLPLLPASSYTSVRMRCKNQLVKSDVSLHPYGNANKTRTYYHTTTVLHSGGVVFALEAFFIKS